MNRVRVGFIGAGWWATVNHMPILAAREDVELVSVCRLGADLLAAVRDRFGFAHATEDFRELLAQDLDAVVVASPHHVHFLHADAALQAGAHVLCEKPMTLDPGDAWRLVEAARVRERHLLIPYGWNYKPFVTRAKELLDEVGIGRVEFASCTMASPTKDFFAGGGAVPADWAPTLVETDPRTWQDPAQGGGYLHGQLTHAAALLLWLTGLRAEEVTARLSSPGAGVDLYDAAIVRFEGGALGSLSGAGTLPEGDPFQIDLRIHGSEGVLLLDVERERVELRRHDGRREAVEIPPGQGAYSCEDPPGRFIDLIQGTATLNASSGELGARVVELLDAGSRSHVTGGGVVTVGGARPQVAPVT